MHSSRVFVRSPYVCRVVKAPICARPLSLFSPTQDLPHMSASIVPRISHEIAPLFRLIEEFAISGRSLDLWSQSLPRRMFPLQPRFDVREIGETYELRGEVPGVDISALQVEFTDAQTLLIRGSTETEATNDEMSTQAANAATLMAAEAKATEEITTEDKSDTISTHSLSSYHKATVEDEEAAEASTSTSARSTPVNSITSTIEESNLEQAANPAATTTSSSNRDTYDQKSRKWLSERTTSSFQRAFNFPSRINQEGVKATLRNGILNITIPKAVAQISRRINVE